MGMAQALGVHFYDAQDQEVSIGGGELGKIHRIDISGIDPRIADCEIVIACDVTNPLCGPTGASAVFGPQKGATPEMAALLDQGLLHYSRLIRDQIGVDIQHVKGSGAAGGLGAGLMAFLSGSMARGIDTVLEAVRIEEKLQEVDLVITGEGHTDAQTAFGKTPVGVAMAAKKYHKPVICISGGIASDIDSLYEFGFDVIIGATQSPMSLQDAMNNAPSLIRHAIISVLRAMLILKK
jgi:glycerate 2-kinase